LPLCTSLRLSIFTLFKPPAGELLSVPALCVQVSPVFTLCVIVELNISNVESRR
jgi:hypothetical protein